MCHNAQIHFMVILMIILAKNVFLDVKNVKQLIQTVKNVLLVSIFIFPRVYQVVHKALEFLKISLILLARLVKIYYVKLVQEMEQFVLSVSLAFLWI